MFVEDRPGHDFRYALNTEKLSNELGWTPLRDFDKGIGETVSWYIDQEDWWRRILTESYDGHRQGLGR
jgi:dTDP-glucose 4,6-dehydratase